MIVLQGDGTTFTPITGNPVIASLDSQRQAPLQTILAESWTKAEQAEFGIYVADIEPEPAYDSDTQKVVMKDTPDVNGLDVSFGWDIVPLDADELQLVIDQQDIDAIKQDAQVLALLRARPAQINTYIDNNVTDMASAKEVLKILARAAAVVAQGIFR